MMGRERHKFILLLMEGESDAAALSKQLGKLFNEIDPELRIATLFPSDSSKSHDLTVKDVESPDKLKGVINRVFIHDFLKDNYLFPNDIVRVIQIVDLDGAFIPNSNVRKGEGGIIYDDPVIYTEHVDLIKQRNRTKQKNLHYLSKLKRLPIFPKAGGSDMRDKMREKSYSVYYFSSNLDHFLHGSANMSSEEKVPMARAFSDKCEADPEYFIDVFTRRDEETKGLTYAESWDYIKEGLNSLRPHSNLGVLVNELLRESKKNAKS